MPVTTSQVPARTHVGLPLRWSRRDRFQEVKLAGRISKPSQRLGVKPKRTETRRQRDINHIKPHVSKRELVAYEMKGKLQAEARQRCLASGDMSRDTSLTPEAYPKQSQ